MRVKLQFYQARQDYAAAHLGHLYSHVPLPPPEVLLRPPPLQPGVTMERNEARARHWPGYLAAKKRMDEISGNCTTDRRGRGGDGGDAEHEQDEDDDAGRTRGHDIKVNTGSNEAVRRNNSNNARDDGTSKTSSADRSRSKQVQTTTKEHDERKKRKPDSSDDDDSDTDDDDKEQKKQKNPHALLTSLLRPKYFTIPPPPMNTTADVMWCASPYYILKRRHRYHPHHCRRTNATTHHVNGGNGPDSGDDSAKDMYMYELGLTSDSSRFDDADGDDDILSSNIVTEGDDDDEDDHDVDANPKVTVAEQASKRVRWGNHRSGRRQRSPPSDSHQPTKGKQQHQLPQKQWRNKNSTNKKSDADAVSDADDAQGGIKDGELVERQFVGSKGKTKGGRGGGGEASSQQGVAKRVRDGEGGEVGEGDVMPVPDPETYSRMMMMFDENTKPADNITTTATSLQGPEQPNTGANTTTPPEDGAMRPAVAMPKTSDSVATNAAPHRISSSSNSGSSGNSSSVPSMQMLLSRVEKWYHVYRPDRVHKARYAVMDVFYYPLNRKGAGGGGGGHEASPSRAVTAASPAPAQQQHINDDEQQHHQQQHRHRERRPDVEILLMLRKLLSKLNDIYGQEPSEEEVAAALARNNCNKNNNSNDDDDDDYSCRREKNKASPEEDKGDAPKILIDTGRKNGDKLPPTQNKVDRSGIMTRGEDSTESLPPLSLRETISMVMPSLRRDQEHGGNKKQEPQEEATRNQHTAGLQPSSAHLSRSKRTGNANSASPSHNTVARSAAARAVPMLSLRQCVEHILEHLLSKVTVIEAPPPPQSPSYVSSGCSPPASSSIPSSAVISKVNAQSRARKLMQSKHKDTHYLQTSAEFMVDQVTIPLLRRWQEYVRDGYSHSERRLHNHTDGTYTEGPASLLAFRSQADVLQEAMRLFIDVLSTVL